MILLTGHVSLPKEGERANGDAVVVRCERDRALFAVIDALGHGPHAAAVADTAVSCLREVPIDRSLEDIVTTLHGALRTSRGAAALVCVVGADRMRGVSVGNVAMRGIGKGALSFVSTPGVLGGTLRRLRVFETCLHRGDRMVCFTDGVSSRFLVDQTRGLSPEGACHVILAGYRRSHDDATVLVVDVAATTTSLVDAPPPSSESSEQ